MSEAEVVRDLKRHLKSGGLDGVVPERILVDADPSYVASEFARELEPMARVDVGDGRPDLLCSSDRTEGTIITGFEVKAEMGDWRKGLTQARLYRDGVHHSYLAIPGKRVVVESKAGTVARDMGVGLLVLDEDAWHTIVRPTNPMPLPWTLGSTAAAIEGVPLARKLQLNHPLNYLVVPYLAATRGEGRTLDEELKARWPTIRKADTRKHAIRGAATLRLIDATGAPTAEGNAVADLLLGLGFNSEDSPSKKLRLAGIAPAIAAIARFVFLQQPAVRLILRSLAEAGGPVVLPQLAMIAARLDPPLGCALFLVNPSAEVRPDLPGAAWNPSTVFKLKQNLWHAGLLTKGAHSSAGGRAADYRPSEDFWALESRRTLAVQ